jgi:hypothetical protein
MFSATWNADPESAVLFRAFEDEVHAVSVLLHHPAQGGQHVILFPHSFLCPLDAYPMVAGEGFHPVLVINGSLAENLPAHDWNAQDFPNKVNHLFGPAEPVQISVDHDPVEAVIYKDEKIAEQPGERVSISALDRVGFSTAIPSKRCVSSRALFIVKPVPTLPA